MKTYNKIYLYGMGILTGELLSKMLGYDTVLWIVICIMLGLIIYYLVFRKTFEAIEEKPNKWTYGNYNNCNFTLSQMSIDEYAKKI